MGFYWSYTLLLEPPVLMRSCKVNLVVSRLLVLTYMLVMPHGRKFHDCHDFPVTFLPHAVLFHSKGIHLAHASTTSVKILVLLSSFHHFLCEGELGGEAATTHCDTSKLSHHDSRV